MKKKFVLEADLDPPNTKRTRPGGYAAKVAMANVRALMKPRAKSGKAGVALKARVKAAPRKAR